MEIKYSERAVSQVKRIAKGDKKSASMILREIENYSGNPRGKFDIKILKGKYGHFKRIRVGNYRVIFNDDENVIFIHEVKHRKEAYHD
jgi:mRNA interferase RelE/StbE